MSHSPSIVRNILDKLFSSFNNKTQEEEEPEKTYPPKVSIQSFKIIRAPNNSMCLIM